MTNLRYRLTQRLRKSWQWLQGYWHATLSLLFHRLCRQPIANLNNFEWSPPFIERREYAQNREDGLINAIFGMIGTTNKYYVEFGVEDGIECNTRYLLKHKGWQGLLMDGSHQNDTLNLQQEFITAENIEELFAAHDVPTEFDLLSIDIDGNDYWVWQAITHYQPRVVIMEYNACIPYEPAVTIPYQADFEWDGTSYYGTSLSALVKLGTRKGYQLVATDSYGVNAFFLQEALCPRVFTQHAPEQLYHPAAFKGKPGNAHPPDTQNRPWVTIE